MAQVTVTWTVADQAVAAPTDLSQYRVAVAGVAEQFVPFGVLSAVFADVAPGDYVAQVALANGDGSHLAFSREAGFSVAQPTVTLAAPDAVTVALG
jgi:hypothetical protein